MTSLRTRRLLLLLVSLPILAACASAPQKSREAEQLSPWPADFGAMRQQAQDQQARLLRIDAAASAVRIHVFRGGRAARLGHNHVLSVPGLQGLVLAPSTPEQVLDGAAFELAFRLDELVLDEPALRAALGPGWASTLSAEAIAATRSNMLGAAGLQAEAYPQVRLRSLSIRGAAPKLGRVAGGRAARSKASAMAGPARGSAGGALASTRRPGAATKRLWLAALLGGGWLAGGAG